MISKIPERCVVYDSKKVKEQDEGTRYEMLMQIFEGVQR